MLFLDIETIQRTDLWGQLINYREEGVVMGKVPANIKDSEKIAQRLEEAQRKYEMKKKNIRKMDAVDIDYAEIIAIGFARIQNPGRKTFDFNFNVKTGTTAKMTEKQLLDKFSTSLENEGGPVVTFNGKSFDINILARRYMMNGLKFPETLKTYHIDLMETLKGAYRNTPKKLIVYAMSMEIPVDLTIADASKLYDCYLNNDWAFIRKHLRQDVWLTGQIFGKMLKHNLIRRQDEQQFNY